MDRLEAMKVLVAVVEAGSLSAASRRLNAPLATVSRKVSDLEAHLQTRLLNRSSRKLALTDAGQIYFAACKRILDLVSDAERVAVGEYSAPKGSLALAAPIAFGRQHVLPVAVDFLKAYPDIDLQLALSDRNAHIVDDRIDLAIRVGELADSSFVASKVGEIRRVVCASPDYFAAHGMPQSPHDLAKHDCVTFDVLMSPEVWMFRRSDDEEAVEVHSRLIVNSAEAAVDAAIAGVGITRVLSYQAVAALRAGKLVAALQSFEPVPSPVSLVYVGQGPLLLKIRAFIDFAAPRLKARLAELAD
ncbi:LysR family transcriptional regulator [Rhizomicrobium electricum]|uniref:LysR family transcriptional regulator n=1 Tax=Rhizomicrobium electricum TaxID=480070 RepID=A0ABN1F791_9PROT|nr:LysR family transcriptional regulator [Rhizomicrobium electricum]NIJ46673.1 DNA-binding transcriptional LysR family regulator [Rhizomicrobium electricum]